MEAGMKVVLFRNVIPINDCKQFCCATKFSKFSKFVFAKFRNQKNKVRRYEWVKAAWEEIPEEFFY